MFMDSCIKNHFDAVQMCPKAACRLMHVAISDSLPDRFAISQPGMANLNPKRNSENLLHSHDVLEIGCCIEGTGVMAVENRIYPFQTGDAWIVNDREMHVSRSNQAPCHCAYLWLDPARLVGAAAREPEVLDLEDLGGPGFPNVLSPETYGEEVHLVRQIVQEMQQKKPGYRAVVRGQVWTLLARLHRISGSGPRPVRGTDRRSMERIAPALHMMAEQYIDDLTFEQLAAACHLSLTHFRRLFCRAMGVPPMRYLAELRVRLAAAMLRGSEKPVIEVALASGYVALNTFNRHFKRIMGVSPREWRKGGSRRPVATEQAE